MANFDLLLAGGLIFLFMLVMYCIGYIQDRKDKSEF